MLWKPVTVLVFLTTVLCVVPGQVQAGEGALGGPWEQDLIAAGYSAATVQSFEVNEVTALSSGELVWRLCQRVGGLYVVGSDIDLVTDASGHLLDLGGEPMDVAREGALSSLIGDRQIMDYLLKWLSGISSGRVRYVGADGLTTFWRVEPSGDAVAVTRVALPLDSGMFQEGFLVEVTTRRGVEHEVVLHGLGQVVSVGVLE